MGPLTVHRGLTVWGMLTVRKCICLLMAEDGMGAVSAQMTYHAIHGSGVYVGAKQLL